MTFFCSPSRHCGPDLGWSEHATTIGACVRLLPRANFPSRTDKLATANSRLICAKQFFFLQFLSFQSSVRLPYANCRTVSDFYAYSLHQPAARYIQRRTSHSHAVGICRVDRDAWVRFDLVRASYCPKRSMKFVWEAFKIIINLPSSKWLTFHWHPIVQGPGFPASADVASFFAESLHP